MEHPRLHAAAQLGVERQPVKRARPRLGVVRAAAADTPIDKGARARECSTPGGHNTGKTKHAPNVVIGAAEDHALAGGAQRVRARDVAVARARE